MKFLYHGTRYLNSILAEGVLRIPRVGEPHVSLTTSKVVARYWAGIVRDDVFGYGFILTLDGRLLERDGFPLNPFESDWAVIEEHEIACAKDIHPLLRYVVAIERVARSETFAPVGGSGLIDAATSKTVSAQ